MDYVSGKVVKELATLTFSYLEFVDTYPLEQQRFFSISLFTTHIAGMSQKNTPFRCVLVNIVLSP